MMKRTFNDMKRKHGLPKTAYLVVNLVFTLMVRNVRWVVMRASHQRDMVVGVLGRKLVVNIQDAGMDFLEGSLPKQLALNSIREVEATKIMNELLKEGDVIVEAGANVGYYVIVESRVIGHTGKIYALEPEPKNYRYLTRNVKLNKLSGLVQTFPLAVSDRSEDLTLYVSKDSNRHNIIHKKSSQDRQITIKAVSIDQFLVGKRKPDWIRMDVEGAECKLIDGMTKTLKNNDLKLFIEIHPHITRDSEYSMVDFLSKIKKLGYEVHKVISHDSFIQHQLRMATVEQMSIDQLIHDKRVTEGICALEVFFIKCKK